MGNRWSINARRNACIVRACCSDRQETAGIRPASPQLNSFRPDTEDMEVQIACSPSYSLAYCYLTQGERLLVESGAMAFMSAGLSVSAGTGPGSMLGAATRKLVGGETFFMGAYEAQIDGAWVAVAPAFPGDIAMETLNNQGLLIEAGALLALSDGIGVDVKFSGAAAVVLREGATMLRCAGTGQLLVGAYGGIQRFQLAEGEQLIVDTGHLVGFSEHMRPQIGTLSSVATSAIIGEGLVGVLEGPGIVLTQSRSEQGLQNWLLPEKSQNRRR